MPGGRRTAWVPIASVVAVLAGVVAACSTQGARGTPATTGTPAAQGAPTTQGTKAQQPAPASGPWIAPYDYLAAGGPSPAEVMKATGIRRFTLAFVVSDGGCQPVWDNGDPVDGASEEAAIRGIRSAGGEVTVSFGGNGGTKLGLTCDSPEALAGVYQQVISAYRLPAIDVDIEDTEIGSAAARQRIIGALAIMRQRDPGLMISVTIAADSSGPEPGGQALITEAAAAALRIDAWTVMPLTSPARDRYGPGQRAGRRRPQERPDERLSRVRVRRLPDHGHLHDERPSPTSGELVSAADFQVILRYVLAHHLARFAFWSVNRDMPCTADSNSNTCSGIAQQPYAYTRVSVSYGG